MMLIMRMGIILVGIVVRFYSDTLFNVDTLLSIFLEEMVHFFVTLCTFLDN